MRKARDDGTLPPVPTSRRGYVALFVGLVAVSTSAPFFVMAHVHAYAAVFWRTLITALLGLGIGTLRGRLDLGEMRRHARSLALGGVLLGAHFLMWVKAFDLTDYASNLLLLVFQPIMAAFLAARLGERLPRHVVLAVSLSVLGLALIAGSDFALSRRALLGDALCLAAGVAITLFYVVTSRVRRVLSVEVFLGSIMLVCAAVSLPVALVAGVQLSGFSAPTWGWLGAIVLITTLTGHGLMNYAANHVVALHAQYRHRPRARGGDRYGRAALRRHADRDAVARWSAARHGGGLRYAQRAGTGGGARERSYALNTSAVHSPCSDDDVRWRCAKAARTSAARSLKMPDRTR